ncbi:MAG TPA: hypothetical protein VMV92_42355 [Streptosporangiaceae bacterium]|nr:hypothetical protein [Streptosporangiaceae bacterium]
MPRPAGLGQVQAPAKILNYRQAFSISTGEQLREVLAEAVLLADPSLLYVTEDPAPTAPPRSSFSTADYADGLTKAATPIADSPGHGEPARSGKGTR